MVEIEEEREQWALSKSRSYGLRLTRGLREIIRVLSSCNKPISIAHLEGMPALGNHYDTSTLYRMLLRLQDKGIVRRIGFHERAAFYILRAPGMHMHFLLCRNCGAVSEVNIDCPIRELDSIIEKRTNYIHLVHDLTFYGLCPKCQ